MSLPSVLPLLAQVPRFFLPVLLFCAAVLQARVSAATLRAGAATVSITPDRPVALWGQARTRISTGVANPVTATVLVLESHDEDGPAGVSTFVACDLIAIPEEARSGSSPAPLTPIPPQSSSPGSTRSPRA